MERIEPPPPIERSSGKPWAGNRMVLEGIVWMLKTVRSGVVCRRSIPGLRPAGKSQACVSTSGVRFYPNWMCVAHWIGKQVSWMPGLLRLKGNHRSRQNRARQGTTCMVVVDGSGFPLGSQLASTSPTEGSLAEGACRPGLPLRFIALAIVGKRNSVDRIRRKGRIKHSLNDGRELRRYRKRRTVERTFALLGNFRCLLVRHDHRLSRSDTYDTGSKHLLPE